MADRGRTAGVIAVARLWRNRHLRLSSFCWNSRQTSDGQVAEIEKDQLPAGAGPSEPASAFPLCRPMSVWRFMRRAAVRWCWR